MYLFELWLSLGICLGKWFPYRFKHFFPLVLEKNATDNLRDWTINCFGWYSNFDNIDTSNLKIWSFHLFISCSVSFISVVGLSEYRYIASLDSFYCCCSVLSHARLFVTSWTAARQASLSFTVSWRTLELISSESVMPSNYLILLFPSPPAFNLPSSRVFSSESVLLIIESKYWGFSFSISPSNEYSGVISFRINWSDLLAIQGILKSLLQHHSSKVSILQHLAFFIVQLSYSYMTTGKTIVMTVWTFVGKVVYLHFNTLSRFVIIFLPRSECLSILWLQLPSAVILEPNKIKTVTVCIFFFFCLLTMKWYDWMPWY